MANKMEEVYLDVQDEISLNSDNQKPPEQPKSKESAAFASTNISQESRETPSPDSVNLKTERRCWKLEFYQGYFDITTQEVLKRLKLSLMPWKVPFFQNNESPDLYGPFWICTTLIFLLAACGNVWPLLKLQEEYKNDVSKLSIAAVVVYGYWVCLPLVCSCLLKGVSFIELLSLYGYAFSPYMPAAILAIPQFSPLRWAVIVVATIFNLLLLERNFWRKAEASNQKIKLGVGCMVLICQCGLILLAEFYFFG